MPPGTRGRKKPKGDVSSTGVLSDAASCEQMGSPPPSRSRLRHTESGSSSSSDGEIAGTPKRLKGDRPAVASGSCSAAVAAAAVVSDDAAAINACKAAGAAPLSPRGSRPRRRPAAVSAPPGTPAVDGDDSFAALNEMKEISSGMRKILCSCVCEPAAIMQVLEQAAKYDDLVARLVATNARLYGKLEGAQFMGSKLGAPVAQLPTARPTDGKGVAAVPVFRPVPAAASSAVSKPVETWSVIVRGKDGAATSKEVVNKVVEQVGPTLGVRVHELKPLRSGGAVIRTPSVAEREKIAANKKFEEVGLQVQVSNKLGPRVVVRGVLPQITPDDFMSELFEMNFKEKMSMDIFKKSVRLVSGPWKPEAGPVNVILEGSERAMNYLLEVGRIYIKWFSYTVRPQNEVPYCFRCLGFDHRRRDCRMKESVCRICSQGGHESWQCQNQPCCRNCAIKGLPADHSLMSSICPTYAALVARANARH